MKKIFLSLFLMLIFTSLSVAQGDVWTYTKDFATINNPNAICKDVTGNIWYGSKTATSGIIVVSSSGTALSFSPIKTVGTASITAVQGLQLDPLDGNIVAIVNGIVLVRINATTGAVMANVTVPAIGANTELSNFGIDQDGNIYFTHITQPAPLEIYDKTFIKVMNVADIATDAPSCMAVTVSNNCDWMWSNTDNSNMQGVQVYAGKTGGGSGIHHFRAGMNYDATAKKYSFTKDSLFSFSRYIFASRGDIESFNWDGSIKAGSPSITAWVGEKGGKALRMTLGADPKGNSMVKDSIAITGQISAPRGIAINTSKELLVADYDKNKITQFNASSIVWKNWLFVKDLLNGTNEFSSHGVVIDKNGVIWAAAYYNWNTVSVPGKKLASSLRFNPDFTVKDTIWRLAIAGSYDTLGLTASSYLARGISLDDDGNILYCGGVASGNTLYRINAKTGAGMNRVNPGVGSLTSAAADRYGHVFIRDVVSSTPKGIMIYPKDFNDNSIPNIAVLPANCPITISRCLVVTPDGNDIYLGSTGAISVGQFHSDNGSDGPYTFKRYIGTYPNGQALAFDPQGRLWIGTNDYLRYDCWDLNTMKLVDGISPGSTTDKTLGRIYTPRGIAFTADGKTIITADFDGQTLQRWTNDISLQPYANVTFRVNTSTVPDTMGAKSVVQIRGSDPLFGPWSDQGAKMTRASGDYWTYTARLKKGDNIAYKFFTNGGAKLDNGWENDILPDGNRVLIVPNSDTILPLQFVNGTPAKQNQYWSPWTINADSINVKFRVNVQGIEGFNKDNQYLAVRGGFPASAGWSKNFVLTPESQHGNGGSRIYDATNFYSGVTRIPKTDVGKTTEYKYVILLKSDPSSVSWEGTDNRTFVNGGDTTIYWRWWEDKAPVPVKGSDTVTMTWTADLSNAIKNKGFFPGDTVWVQYGHEGSGKDMLGNSPAKKFLKKTGLTGNNYTVTDTLITKIGSDFYYQYYLTKNGVDYREIFFNFDYAGAVQKVAERRSILPAKTNTIQDIENSVTTGRRQPLFRNTTKLARNVKVTVTCDLRSAYYSILSGLFLNDIQSTVNISKADSVYLNGVYINGPMVSGWAGWGGALRDSVKQKLWDDGPHGDATAGDHIYTNQFDLLTTYSDGRERVGQEFKFGIGGGDNESGFGLNHYENIDDSQPTYLLDCQFGSINPNRYFTWDYNTHALKVQNNFTVQTTGTTSRIRSIKAINEKIVWVCGADGLVLRTVNGGTTWEKKTVTDAAFTNYVIEALDSNTAWAGGTNTNDGVDFRIWKTADGGKTWKEQYKNTGSFSDDIKFFNASNGVAYGDPVSTAPNEMIVLTTSDGGTTWNRVDATKVPAVNGAKAEMGSANGMKIMGNTVWFVTYSDDPTAGPHLFKSTDKGATWTAYGPVSGIGSFLSVDFKDDNNGVCVDYNVGKGASTTDGGKTWTVFPIDPAQSGLRSVHYLPGTDAIVAAGGSSSTGTFFSSPNKGATWQKLTLPTGTQRLYAVEMYSSTVGWMGGNNGILVKWTGNPVGLTPVKQVESIVPLTYALYQNYPNPFNPTTTINYDLPKISKVTLKIYNSLGQEVKTLVNDVQSPGKYQVTFSSSNIASGMYFYKIQAEGFNSIKKMLLLK
jgi:photosystem II stability/assembly factor-like uncharacterized protein/sugar lactone lactonase YvrE